MFAAILRASSLPPWIARCLNSSYIVFMTAHGICKITNGWVHQDSVWVQYDDGERLEIPASQYREESYQPPIEALPECSRPHTPRGPKGDKGRD
jgi:hypothetical protein